MDVVHSLMWRKEQSLVVTILLIRWSALERPSSPRLVANILHRRSSMHENGHTVSPLCVITALHLPANLWRCSPLPFPTLGKAVGHQQLQWCISVLEGFSVGSWYLNITEQLLFDNVFQSQQWPNLVTKHWESLFYYQAPEPLCSTPSMCFQHI